MTDAQHAEVLELILRRGVPDHYPTTLFGNYSPTVVTQIIVDALNSYRSTSNAMTGGQKDD
jgi:hypothetical protein